MPVKRVDSFRAQRTRGTALRGDDIACSCFCATFPQRPSGTDCEGLTVTAASAAAAAAVLYFACLKRVPRRLCPVGAPAGLRVRSQCRHPRSLHASAGETLLDQPASPTA